MIPITVNDLTGEMRKDLSLVDSFKKGLKIIKSNGRTDNGNGSYSLTMRVCIDGIIHRICTAKRRQVEVKNYDTVLLEFMKHYDIAKKAFSDGDLESVGRFFMLYIGDEE